MPQTFSLHVMKRFCSYFAAANGCKQLPAGRFRFSKERGSGPTVLDAAHAVDVCETRLLWPISWPMESQPIVAPFTGWYS